MDDAANELKGQRVLVTRPEPEHQAFCQWVREQGGEPVSFPLIKIAPSLIPVSEIAKPVAGVIFISKAAIHYGFWSFFKAVFASHPHQGLLPCYTVGQASAAYLKNCYEQERNNQVLEHKVSEHVTDVPVISIGYPYEGHGGEALLKLSRFKNLENEHWWIVRGGAGLEWLYHEMTGRGAWVRYWDAYLRQPIIYSCEQIQAILQEKIDIILLFSGEIVQIFEAMLSCLSIECQNRVKSVKVWVLSDRVADLARKAGFPDIKILTEPFFKKEAF